MNLSPEQLATLQAQMLGCPFCGSADVHIMQGMEGDIRFECDECFASIHFDGGARFAPSLSLSRYNRRKEIKAKGTPGLEEVRAYCEERRNGIDAQTFIDYYDARGWKLSNGCKVKDWRALVRRWEQLRKQKEEERRKADNSRRPQHSSIDPEELKKIFGDY